jgi:ParB-like chromosome segregation protein Spo0J
MMQAIPTINVKELKPHPQNIEIYGEEDIEELANRIKESGWIKPLVIKSDGTVISGHRRLKACLLLGIEEVEYEAIYFNNKNEELERLLLENESREKTTYQKIQEGKFWEDVIKEKARLRKLSTLNNQSVEVENSPQREKEEVGKTRDIVAKKIGLGSGKTYETAKKIVKEIDKLKDEGKEKNSDFLKTVLNETGNGAKDLLKNDLSDIGEELKDKVINKEITAKEAIKEIKKEAETLTDTDVKIENKPQEQEKIIEASTEESTQITETVENTLQNILDVFKSNIEKYSKMDDELEEIPQESKHKIIDCIGKAEEILRAVKGLLM